MYTYLVTYLTTATVFLAADILWLTGSARLYRQAIGDMMLDTLNWKAGVLFYLIYIVGIVFFVVFPSDRTGPSVLVAGALFGLVAFATYDLTNLATLKRWSLKMSLIDMVWGMLVTALSGFAGFFAMQMTGH